VNVKLLADTFATLLPFRYTPYPATPTLSVDADHETGMLVSAMVPTASPLGTLGDCESAQAPVVAVVVVCVEWLPAASLAWTARV
jgi:hypothetical protein